MRTEDFITKYAGIKGKARTCASVLSDSNGVIYSYGHHYPLLFEVANKRGTDHALFVNDRGYSATTSKHIAYARGVAKYSVWLALGSWGYTEYDTDAVEKGLQREKFYIEDQVNAKKRKDTQVYRSLVAQLKEVQNALDFINS